MIRSLRKNLKFLPNADHVVGRWIALTSPGSGVADVFIMLGAEITMNDTKLSFSQLVDLGYQSKYKIYPIIDRLQLDVSVRVTGNFFPVRVRPLQERTIVKLLEQKLAGSLCV